MSRAQAATLDGGLDDIAVPGLVESLDSLRIAITLFDSNERLIYANRHFDYLMPSVPPRQRLYGRTYEDLIRLEVASNEIAGAKDIEAYVAARRAQLADGDYRPRDIHLIDGRVIELKARRTAQDGWIVLWSDVTHARELLGRLENAIELTADAFAFFDHDGRLAMCNRGFANLHGSDEPLKLAGRSSVDIVRSAAERGLFRIEGPIADWIAQRLETQNAAAGAMTVTTAAGTAYLVRERATRNGGVTVFTDITDRNRAEAALVEQGEALERAKMALDESERAARKQARYLADLSARLDRAQTDADVTKKTLLRTMSHELKTPLNAIIGFSDLMGSMADRLNPDQIRDYAALVHQGGRNLLTLINQILDLTKIAAGKFELHRGAVDVARALDRALDEYLSEAEAKGIAVEVLDGISLLADGDADILDTMLRHLVANAVQFTKSGGHVRLSAKEVAKQVLISVADDGPGVKEEDLSRILLPFEQALPSDTEHTMGAGLGLTLVSAFAELQGGALRIESRSGEGFTATIVLSPALPA